MQTSEYQSLAMRTSTDGHDRVLNGCLGLIGESGEVVDIAKKWKFQSGDNAEIPKDKLIDECGDVLWYCAELCQGLKIDLERIIREIHREPVCVAATGKFQHDAVRLSQRCAEIYEMYYGSGGEFKSKNVRKVQHDHRRRMRFIETEIPAPIAYPAALKDAELWYRYDTVTLDIGDIVLYVEAILKQYAGSTLDEAMEKNIGKLKKRYPDGFDPERSLHRSE